jgi:hypothetical protein
MQTESVPHVLRRRIHLDRVRRVLRRAWSKKTVDGALLAATEWRSGGNQTVVGTTRSLLKSKGLPGWLWGEAVATAVYLLNRSPTRGVEGKTSFEGWYGKKPGVQHLRTFGCLVHVKDTSPNLKKLNDRSRPMIFIGYEPGSKAYRAYNPVSKKVHVSRDIVFDEQASWNCSDGGEHSEQVNNDMFTVEMEYSTVIQGVPDAGAEAGAPAMMSPDGSPESLSRSPSPVQIGADGNGDQMVEPITPHGVREEDLDANHDEDMPLRLRAIEDILGPAPPQGLARRVLAQELNAVSSDEPSNFEEAEQDPSWRRAMLVEMKSIEENDTWCLADLPSGRRAIGLKWMFKVKRDVDGNLVKHKARLVVKGYAQRSGIDYDEVFAPVARLDSVQLLIALATSEGWEVHHLDVKSAFLNGGLQEVFAK